jgi:hypothetical protein
MESIAWQDSFVLLFATIYQQQKDYSKWLTQLHKCMHWSYST